MFLPSAVSQELFFFVKRAAHYYLRFAHLRLRSTNHLIEFGDPICHLRGCGSVLLRQTGKSTDRFIEVYYLLHRPSSPACRAMRVPSSTIRSNSVAGILTTR